MGVGRSAAAVAVLLCLMGSAAFGASDGDAGPYRREGRVLIQGNWAAPVLWWGAVTMGGWATCPLWAGRRGRRALLAVACGRPLWVLGLGYTVWLAGLTGWADFSQTMVWICSSVWVAGGGLAWVVRREGLLALLRGRWKQVLLFEGACLAAFLAMLACRAWHPNLDGGEKVMDLAHINVILRSRSFPPVQPWLGVLPMNYYYLGYLMAACLIKLTGVPTLVAYNVAVATWFGLAFGAAWAAGWWVSKRLWAGAVAAVLFAVMGNLQALRLMWAPVLGLSAGGPGPGPGELPIFGAAFFWRLTRLSYGNQMCHEFPFWTHLWADLHPHLFAMPIYLVALAWLYEAYRGRMSLRRTDRIGSSLSGLAFGGWLVGTLAVINTWDWAVFMALGWLAWLGRLILLRSRCGPIHARAAAGGVRSHMGASGIPSAASRGGSVVSEWLGPALVFSIISILAGLPFWRTFQQGNLPLIRKVDEMWLSPVHLAVIFGVPVGFLLIWAVAHRTARIWSILATVIVTAAAGLAIQFARTRGLGQAWAQTGGLVAGLCAAAGVLLFVLSQRPGTPPRSGRWGWAWWLAACAALIVAACEVVSLLGDRFNTVFKLHLPCWGLLAVAVSVLWARPFIRLPRRVRIMAGCLAGVLAGAGLYTTVAAAISFKLAAGGPVPTLDAGIWFRRLGPSQMRAADWLNRNVRGVPVLLEAEGPAYGPSARMCQLTGLPIVVGWRRHLQEKGYDPARIDERIADVIRIYRGRDRRTAGRLLDRYGVSYVFVGTLERQRYGANVRKFEGWLPAVFRDGDVVVYAAWPRGEETDSDE